MEQRSIRRERISQGLCPNCGKESAPFHLCQDCRFGNKITAILRRGEKVGGFKSERKGRDTYWSIGANQRALDTIKWRADPKPGDKRLLPRIGRIPMQIEDTIIAALMSLDRPATIEEIRCAWVKLKANRGGGSLSSHVLQIIEAARRRGEKNARRAEIAHRSVA